MPQDGAQNRPARPTARPAGRPGEPGGGGGAVSRVLRRPLDRPALERALALEPLGEAGDDDLNPGHPRPVRLRAAAVLCPLVPRASQLHVVLTRRAAHLRQHAGQIAFPGGRVDPEDPSPRAAALREAHEEVGLPAAAVEVLGELDPYVTVTGFRVSPFVGLIDPDWRPQPDPGEVDLVFEVPLDFLMDPANHLRGHHDRGPVRRHFHAMPWAEHYIWGATAGMLKGLSDRLHRLGDPGGDPGGNPSGGR